MVEGSRRAGATLQPMTTALFILYVSGGGERDRTDDLLVANQALSQLSYTPDLTFDYRINDKP